VEKKQIPDYAEFFEDFNANNNITLSILSRISKSKEEYFIMVYNVYNENFSLIRKIAALS
jgi:hypothetical protein